MDVTPEQVIECMNEAKIKDWVLMGLHGYVGYLPMPRATQDVDVMVPYRERKAAERAISARWPELKLVQLSQVSRFSDPSDVDHEGKPNPVIDLMMPWGPFQETILKKYVIRSEDLVSRYPTVEAAIVSKYAALVSPNRKMAKKHFDAGDLRQIICHNIDSINRDVIQQLGDQVWENGGAELLEFIELALQEKPFPL